LPPVSRFFIIKAQFTDNPKGGDKMTVSAVPLISRLQLRVRLGYDAGGNPIVRTRSYSNIKVDAGDQDLFDTGQDLAALQEHALEVIRRVDEAELEES
jgi:hypothetical protein